MLARFNIPMRRARPRWAKTLSLLILVSVLAPFTLGTTAVPLPLRFEVSGTLQRPPGAAGPVFVSLVARGGECNTEAFEPLMYGPWGGQTNSEPVVLSGADDEPNTFEVSATSWCKPDYVAVTASAPGQVMVVSDPVGVSAFAQDSVYAESTRRLEPVGCGYVRDEGTVSYVASVEHRMTAPLVVPVPY